MGQAQINVRTRACSGTFIARTKQAALTHNVRGKRLKCRYFSRMLALLAGVRSYSFVDLPTTSGKRTHSHPVTS